MLSHPVLIGMLNSVVSLSGTLLAWLAFTTANYGVLHTLPDFIYWHEKEEELVRLFQGRMDFLRRHKERTTSVLHYRKTKINWRRRHKNGWSTRSDNHPPSKLISAGRRVALLEKMHQVHMYKLYELLRLRQNERSPFYSDWIGFPDKMYSSLGFVNLQLFYLLYPEQTASGLTLDTEFGGHLRSAECSEIGMFALTQKWVHMAVQWLEEATRKSQVNLGVVPALLSVAIQQHNALGYREDLNASPQVVDNYRMPVSNLFTAPILPHQDPRERKELAQLDFERYRGWGPHPTRVPEQGMDLCQGNVFQPPKVTSRLKCYYEHDLHPYLYPGPIKTEVLSESPYILQFYQVLSNTTIDKMKALHRARVVPETDIHDALALRTCGNHARHNLNLRQEPRELLQMSRILSGGLTPLVMERENMFGEYTYGRLYNFHVDHSSYRIGHKDEVRELGERFATLLYYVGLMLELPQLGGYTPFIEAGVYARPERGSAIFWYSLFKNGTLRMDVSHGSCPIIHGSKIIVSHFFRHNKNWERFKCTLNQWE